MTTRQMAEVMLAADAPGAVVEKHAWNDTSCAWRADNERGWNWHYWNYRIKPSPKLVPLSREDFEGVTTWIRIDDEGASRSVTAMGDEFVTIGGWEKKLKYGELHERSWQYSQPSRFQGWKPCSKESNA